MKKFFLIAGLMVAAVIAVAFGSCTNTNTANQAAENTAVATTPTPTETFTASPTPTATPSPTATAAEVKNRVYTNDKFGYKITLPAGYTASVESRTGVPYDQDKVTIKDTAGKEFAFISTPPPEIGWELWLWDQARRSVSKISGGNDSMYRYEVRGDKAMGMEQDLIVASWGADMHDSNVTSTRDYSQQGLISAEVDSLTSADAQKVRDMITSLRLL